MLDMRRSFTRLASLFLTAVLLILVPYESDGQSTPSADQIELFRNLTPDQQDAILKQLSGSGSTGTGTSGSSSTSTGTDLQGQSRQSNQNPNDQQRNPRSAQGQQQPLIPLIKGDDWVVVEIDYHLAARPLSQTLQSYYAGIQGNPSAQNVQAIQAALAAQGGTGAGVPGGLQQGTGTGTNQQLPATPESLLTPEEKKTLDDLMALIRSRNPYQLTHDGELVLPGFAPMPLGGLTEEQATLRLRVEPAFRAVEVRLTRLPLNKTGYQSLKPFGYDLFNTSASTFSPATNVPVPDDYVLGAGDQLDVQLYGSQNRSF
jgi:hypothetical protein